MTGNYSSYDRMITRNYGHRTFPCYNIFMKPIVTKDGLPGIELESAEEARTLSAAADHTREAYGPVLVFYKALGQMATVLETQADIHDVQGTEEEAFSFKMADFPAIYAATFALGHTAATHSEEAIRNHAATMLHSCVEQLGEMGLGQPPASLPPAE